MTSPSKNTRPRQLLPLAAIIAIAIVALITIRSNRPPRPSLFVGMAPGAVLPTRYEGNWYWVDRPDPAHAALVRIDESGAEHQLILADEIADYAFGTGGLIVISRSGTTWRATLADSNGGATREVYSGMEQPHGALIADNVAYWLRPKAAIIPDAAVFPPLGPQLELMASSLPGGESKLLATIMEPQGDAVIGVANGSIWVSGCRTNSHDATIVYRIPVGGGEAHKTISETGRQSVILTPSGVLYWTAPSREAQNFDQVVCIRRLSTSGAIETLNEWLPAGGELFNTAHGVYYVDGKVFPNAWPVTSHDDLPTLVPVAEGFNVFAAGDNDILLKRQGELYQKSSMYRIRQK